MNRLRLTIMLMVLTIGVIVAFQVYWLRTNYMDQRKVFILRTNLLFRESVFRLQADKLHVNVDTSFNIRLPDPSGVINMVKIIRDKVSKDSTGQPHHSQAVIVRMDHDPMDLPDSDGKRVFYRTPNARVADFLSGVDSLQEPITTKEVSDRFGLALSREKIHVPYVVTAEPVDKRKDIFLPDSNDNCVIVGFSKPVAFRLNMGNSFWFIARGLGPQLLFSLVLVGVTIFSFLLLYRNWRQQQKLTILKNDFISNITHELKTPIATVSVAVEAMKNFNALQDPVRTREYLDISDHELRRLSLLVDKVLKLSLFEKQEIELKKDEFDLKMLVEEVMGSMRLQFEKYGARVRLWAGPDRPGFRVVGPGRKGGAGDVDGGAGGTGDVGTGDGGKGGSEEETGDVDGEAGGARDVGTGDGGPGKFLIRADKMHFTSVVYNLLDNALKYSKAKPSMLINLHWETEFLILSVTDSGIGIPAEYKDRIFEKFFRVPTGDHHNVKGYGLGLSYVAYIVQRHGGEIKVRSEEGLGSKFTVKIPRGYA